MGLKELNIEIRGVSRLTSSEELVVRREDQGKQHTGVEWLILTIAEEEILRKHKESVLFQRRFCQQLARFTEHLRLNLSFSALLRRYNPQDYTIKL